jgi:hypothetical protein
VRTGAETPPTLNRDLVATATATAAHATTTETRPADANTRRRPIAREGGLWSFAWNARL